MDEHKDIYYFLFLYLAHFWCWQWFLIFRIPYQKHPPPILGIFTVMNLRGPSLSILNIPFPQYCYILILYKCSSEIQQYLVIKQSHIRALQCAQGTFSLTPAPEMSAD